MLYTVAEVPEIAMARAQKTLSKISENIESSLREVS